MAHTKQLKLIVLMCFVGILAVCQMALCLELPVVTRVQAEKDPLACVMHLASNVTDTSARKAFIGSLIRDAARRGEVDKALDLLPATNDVWVLGAVPFQCMETKLQPKSIRRLASELQRAGSQTGIWRFDFEVHNLVECCANSGYYSLGDSITSALILSPYYRGTSYLLLADTCLKRGLKDLAVEFLVKATQVSPQSYAEPSVSVLCEVADRYWELGIRNNALELVRTAENLIHADSVGIVVAGYMRDIAERYIEFGLHDRIPKLMAGADSLKFDDLYLPDIVRACLWGGRRDYALQAATMLGEISSRVESLAEVAEGYLDVNQPDSAQQIVDSALRLLSDTLELWKITSSLCAMARAYSYCGYDSTALSLLSRAFDLGCKTSNDTPSGRVDGLGVVVETSLELGYMDASRSMLQELSGIGENAYWIADAYANLREAGRIDEAEQVLLFVDESEVTRAIREGNDYKCSDLLVAESLLAAVRREHRPPGDSATRHILDGVLALAECPSLTLDEVEQTNYVRLPQLTLTQRRAVEAGLAWAYLSNGDTALATTIIDDVIRISLSLLHGLDRGDSLREAFRLCLAVGDPGRMFNIRSYGWFPESHYYDLVFCFAERGMWSECLETARGLPSLRQRNLALLALAGWYYILRPDTGDKQTDFLRRFVAVSEK